MDEHVGVKAPGRANTTARFPLKSSSDVTSFHVNGLSPPIFSSRILALNVIDGTTDPSVAAAAMLRADRKANRLAEGHRAVAVERSESIVNNKNTFPRVLLSCVVRDSL